MSWHWWKRNAAEGIVRILIDTNVLISAILGHGTPYRAYVKAVTYPHTAILCDQNVSELKRIFARKFPQKLPDMEHFLQLAYETIELVAVPEQMIPAEQQIRDAADRPILRAAYAAKVDVLLTGDKDFLASGLTTPRILTPAEFLRL